MLLLVLLTAAAVRPAQAQVLQGTLRAADGDGRAVEGALVVLMAGEERIAATFTNAAGLFRFQVPRPGAYRLLAERIGFESEVTAPIEVPPEGATYTFRLNARAIELGAIDVRATVRCEGSTSGGTALRLLWSEARKALAAAAVTATGGFFRYGIVTWERDLDARTLAVQRETQRTRSVVSSSPFRSLSADELARDGYVREAADGSISWHAPDAAVLLSDAFLAEHCLRVVDGERDDQVGLAFEPAQRSDHTDIEGVLWLDRTNAELHSLEFRYVQLPYGVRDSRMGGTIRFERRPEGPWIVRAWSMRMPLLARGPLLRYGEMEVHVDRVREIGGEVVDLQLDPDRFAALDAERARAAAAAQHDSSRERVAARTEPPPFRLPAIEVEAESRRFDLDRIGFYERRQNTTGRFYTREQIEQRNPLRPTHMLQGIPGLRFAATHGTGQAIWFRIYESRGRNGEVIPCGPRLFLDGLLVHPGGRDNPLLLDDFVNINDVAGIEVYRGASELPPQYAGAESMCGVFLVWTRFH